MEERAGPGLPRSRASSCEKKFCMTALESPEPGDAAAATAAAPVLAAPLPAAVGVRGSAAAACRSNWPGYSGPSRGARVCECCASRGAE